MVQKFMDDLHDRSILLMPTIKKIHKDEEVENI